MFFPILDCSCWQESLTWMGPWPCFLLPSLDGAERGPAAIRRLPVFGKVDGSTAQNSAAAKTYVCKQVLSRGCCS